MRTGFLVVLVLHGLIHVMGFAKAFGYAEIPALTLPISRGQGVLWLLAGHTMLLTAGCLVQAPRLWGSVGLRAVVKGSGILRPARIHTSRWNWWTGG
ncbi:MAG: hypothetical protein SH809_06345 [Rhodothermales bacterium]|nr:hypothetical protein [Rhodothermales bacterium]